MGIWCPVASPHDARSGGFARSLPERQEYGTVMRHWQSVFTPERIHKLLMGAKARGSDSRIAGVTDVS